MTSTNLRSPRQSPVLSRAILVTMRRLLALMLVVGLAPSLLQADEAGVSRGSCSWATRDTTGPPNVRPS